MMLGGRSTQTKSFSRSAAWTTDEAAEFHLHGDDIRLNLNPGAPGTMTFEAHAAGRFPVGIHGSGGHGHCALVYLEVHPR